MLFNAFVIAFAVVFAQFPFVFGYVLADGGFSDSLIDFTIFTNVRGHHHPLGVRQLGQGTIPTQCDSICNPVIASLSAVSTFQPYLSLD
jgi:hypothetical protein